MSSRVIENLRKVEILAGLSDDDLLQVSGICKAVRVPTDRTIFKEGDDGDELYVIHEGSVRVLLNTRTSTGTITTSTINMLYPGQCFGELVLLNGISRSATIVAAEPTTLIVVREPDFRNLCESNPRIGYIVMRNLAQDLAYKLRSSNLLLRGDIRWQSGELGRP
jgi:CRP-like cAMP-binding protein